ncbi:carbohydrate porin [Brenneria tiliae]|uniref:Carbohydrate porin n=1 Tax=Brenneria tiliae TaxID=2914984 RepID=A0ABT0MY91_9GAMM|nr:carbohydrate porin [Brenneria tiliae]MCL2894268.1 carbohydrate porin [Brenneria tiliae]
MFLFSANLQQVIIRLFAPCLLLIFLLSHSAHGNEAGNNDLSDWRDYGIEPVLYASGFHLENPTLGQITDMSYNLYILTYGANVDLEKLAGFDNLKLHFEQYVILNATNVSYGMMVGDSVYGDPVPYGPKRSRLQKLTLEYTTPNNKMNFEIGKSAALMHFATPVCNLIYSCISPLIPSLFYASWGGRSQYNFNENWSAQVGGWNIVTDYPFEHGWEWKEKSGAMLWMSNLAYNDKRNSLELMLFHSTEQQTNPYTGKKHDGTSGFYVAFKTEIYQGKNVNAFFSIPNVAIVEQFTQTFDQSSTIGLQHTNLIGLNIGSPFTFRPHDSYGVSLKVHRLTSDQQRYTHGSFVDNGIYNYTAGRNQKVLQLDANFVITPEIILSPYINFSWDTNSRFNPYDHTHVPQDGYAFGVLGVIRFDRLFGF